MCIIGSSITRRQDAIIIRSPGHCFTNSDGMMSYSKFLEKESPQLDKVQTPNPNDTSNHELHNSGREKPTSKHPQPKSRDRKRGETQREIDRERESEGEGGSVLTGGANGICCGLKR